MTEEPSAEVSACALGLDVLRLTDAGSGTGDDSFLGNAVRMDWGGGRETAGPGARRRLRSWGAVCCLSRGRGASHQQGGVPSGQVALQPRTLPPGGWLRSVTAPPPSLAAGAQALEPAGRRRLLLSSEPQRQAPAGSFSLRDSCARDGAGGRVGRGPAARGVGAPTCMHCAGRGCRLCPCAAQQATRERGPGGATGGHSALPPAAHGAVRVLPGARGRRAPPPPAHGGVRAHVPAQPGPEGGWGPRWRVGGERPPATRSHLQGTRWG